MKVSTIPDQVDMGASPCPSSREDMSGTVNRCGAFFSVASTCTERQDA
jgi:hypothetical protein